MNKGKKLAYHLRLDVNCIIDKHGCREVLD